MYMSRALRRLALLVVVAFGTTLCAVAPASAVTLDDSVRACLNQTVGTKETQRIAKAVRLTSAQRRQVAACRRTGAGASTTSNSVVVWSRDGKGGWVTSGRPPACPTIDWTLPIDDLSTVQAVLDPGQVRGGRYKGHGGFRLSSSNTTVRSPLDGYLVSAAAYLEKAQTPGSVGEVQYMVDIQHPCGYIVRFDHLKALSPPIAAAVASVPLREDSQTTMLNPPLRVTRGQVLATTVGHTENSLNMSFDFGVYDARSLQPNRRSDAELLAFGPDGDLGRYAICWLDLFGAANAATLRALPRTSTEAAQGSDVCR
jgi:hypothetical protein